MPRPTSLPGVADDAAKKKFIYQGPAAYFNPVMKSWQYGTFTVHYKCIQFVAKSADAEDKSTTPYHLTLPYGSISAIKKRTSYFVYPALVIEVGSESHWFSSLDNRDSMYNLLELFWRNGLLSKHTSLASSNLPDFENASVLGKHLLSKLHESKETLISTAAALEEQNKQLSDAQQAIYDLNADLKNAETFLNSNHPVTKIFQNESGGENHPALESAKNILNRRRKYKVTFNNSSSNDYCPIIYRKGFLFVGDEDFQLTDEEDKQRFCIPYDEVIEIIVISPWEIRVNQSKFCGVETSYNIICPAMVQLSKTLLSYGPLSSKLVHKNDIIVTSTKPCSPDNLSSSSSSSLASISVASCSSADISQLMTQVKKMKSSGSLMQEEVEEISSILESLVDLASDVNKEYESQMEKILQLVDDINKTELRIKSGRKMMNKIT